jgi:hypothetical protein
MGLGDLLHHRLLLLLRKSAAAYTCRTQFGCANLHNTILARSSRYPEIPYQQVTLS